MTQKGKIKPSSLKNNLHPDDGFDLDEYLEEQAAGEQNKEPEEDGNGYFFRNAAILFLLAATIALWTLDWKPVTYITSFFGAQDEPTVVFVERNAPSALPAPVPAPTITAPPATPLPPNTSGSYTDYLEQLNNAGFLDDFSGTSATRLYEARVPIAYLNELSQAGVFSDFGSTSITRLYSNNVPTEYVQQFKQAGLLNDFGSTSLVNLYQNQVPFDYIKLYKDNGLLDDFGGTSVTRLYQNQVP
ncbi:MAG: hypothetical protein AAFW89_11420, partial [Bacteroidota bacterium]